MAKQVIIPDQGTLHFFARAIGKAETTYTPLALIGWAIDDESLEARPVVYPPLQESEVLVYHSPTGYKEVQ